MTFHEEYVREKNTPSDIYEHLTELYEYGMESHSIIEFGVGYGRSTRAFLAALEIGWVDYDMKKSLRSYDIKVLSGVDDLFQRAKNADLDAEMIVGSTLEADFEKADLLLVDSHHTFDQVEDELQLHGNKIQKYIIFHDVVLYGQNGQDPGSGGILEAIFYWMSENSHWSVDYYAPKCNGLLVLCRNRT